MSTYEYIQVSFDKYYKGGAQEVLIVATGGAIKVAQGNLGGDIAGGQDKTDQEVHAVGEGKGLDISWLVRQEDGDSGTEK